jgi:transcriptional regulator with XRE-family HTH domain
MLGGVMETTDERAGGATMTDDLQAEWGIRVRELRIERGMSQYKLARLAEIDARHLARIESGEVNAGDEKRMRIAAALEVAVEDIWRYPRPVAS